MGKESLEKAVEKIAAEAVKHTEAIKRLVTRKEFNDKIGHIINGQDRMMFILNRLDQEGVASAGC